jgi:hypothetical protein
MVARFALVLALATTLAAGSGVAGGRSVARPIAPRNEIIAKLDAEAHLSDLSLPAGAARSEGEPAGDGGTLAYPFSGPADTPNVVTYHRWWAVPGESPTALLQYVQNHPPQGGQPGFAGSNSGPGKPTVTAIGFSWPSEPGRLGTRTLVIDAVQLADGSAGVRADSQVVWIEPRPKSERIPAGARRLVLTTTRSRRLVQGPLTVRSPGAIHRVVRLLNALPALQPGVSSCPADLGSQIRLSFYDGTKAQPLAVAVADPGGCGVVTLTIRGHPQQPLTAGLTLPGRLSRALGVKVDTGILSRSVQPFDHRLRQSAPRSMP